MPPMPNLTCIRRVKDCNFTTINNTICRDNRVSLKAKGFMLVVMGLPDDWDFTVRGMTGILKEGRDAVYSILDELIEFGYVTRTVPRKSGRIQPTEYIFHESPHTAFPDVVEPDRVNPPQLKTYSIKDLKNEESTLAGGNSDTAAEKSPPDHKVLMEHHGLRIGKILDGAAQGAAVKKLLHNYPREDCLKCYDHLVSQLKSKGGWRSTKVSWLTVISEIGEWKSSQRPGTVYNVLDFDLPQVRYGGEVDDMPSSRPH